MESSHSKRQTCLICLALALAILAVYSPLLHARFVLFDDNDYVVNNDTVKQGLTWPAITWAFSTMHTGNWHPLTWISHLTDIQLYNLNPAGHHATSVLLHVANSILLFLLLQRMTGARWPSAMVAALFALHPLHVESVAWISERKDVLSTLFWMLSAVAYVRYAEESGKKSGRAKIFYCASIVFFGLGLMAKSMLVTLPLVFLILDYWPLRRLHPPFGRLLMEKTPYFLLAAAVCIVTWMAQKQEGAITSLAATPLGLRLSNTPIAYLRYLEKTFWPVNLAVFYPMPKQWPLWQAAGAALILGLITVWVVYRARTQRYLAAGWLWFLGMLVPVIGLVAVGSQAMADRYDYVPSVGIFIMVVWSARTWLAQWSPQAVAILAMLVLAGCMAASFAQVRYWQDSDTLFRHAIAVTGDNGAMENNLGKILFQEGRIGEALPHLLRAVEFSPNFPLPHFNLGNAWLAQGKVADALSQFEMQVSLSPGDPIAQYTFGRVLLDQGLAEMALPHLEKAVQLRPEAADFHYKLGNACRQTGRAAEAIRQYEKALEILPNYLQPASSLAWMLASNPNPALRNGAQAVQMAKLAIRLSGDQDPNILGILGAAYAEAGDFSRAGAAAERALSLAEAKNQTALAGLLRAQLALYRASKPFRDLPGR